MYHVRCSPSERKYPWQSSKPTNTNKSNHSSARPGYVSLRSRANGRHNINCCKDFFMETLGRPAQISALVSSVDQRLYPAQNGPPYFRRSSRSATPFVRNVNHSFLRKKWHAMRHELTREKALETPRDKYEGMHRERVGAGSTRYVTPDLRYENRGSCGKTAVTIHRWDGTAPPL